MKLSALALCCALATLFAFTYPAAVTIDQEDKKAGDSQELEKQMKTLKSVTRRLRKKFRSKDVKANDVLADLRSCSNAIMASRYLFPENLKGEAHAKKRAEYTSIMIDCLTQSLNCEKAVLAGDMKKAATAFKACMAEQKKGHDKFRE